MAAGADVAGEVGLGDGRVGIGRRLDAVDAVAIGAGGRKLITLGHGLPVDALHEGGFDVGVALTTGGGDVDAGNGRFGVARRQNLVCAVAIGADRGFFAAGGDGAAMDTVLIGDEGLGADAVSRHQEALAVATAAGGGNVVVMH